MARSRSSLSTRRARPGDINWNVILVRAKDIVESYDTGVTLRQLYYRLVSEGLIPNRQNYYKTLSSKTAQARREGWFPNLIDRTREIEIYQSFTSAGQALRWLEERYRRDRTEGQEWSIYLGVEKHGLTTQLVHWFGRLGIPVLALGGYSSQTFVDEVSEDVRKQDRRSVLLYAGDFDPSGMDIDRDFIERGRCFNDVVRVALTAEIVEEYDLPPMPGKATDSRSARFMMQHGELVQVELDALPPDDLRRLYQEAIDPYWDDDAFDTSIKRESQERETLADIADTISYGPTLMAESFIEKIEDDADLQQVLYAVQTRRSDLGFDS